jgi:hypothetical protein
MVQTWPRLKVCKRKDQKAGMYRLAARKTKRKQKREGTLAVDPKIIIR